MTIELQHYLIGIIPVWRSEPPIGEPIFLRHIVDVEADDLGYSFAGESLSESVVVESADTLSRYSFNPNRGSMDRTFLERLTKDKINHAKVEGNPGCLSGVLGYRQRYVWRRS